MCRDVEDIIVDRCCPQVCRSHVDIPAQEPNCLLFFVSVLERSRNLQVHPLRVCRLNIGGYGSSSQVPLVGSEAGRLWYVSFFYPKSWSQVDLRVSSTTATGIKQAAHVCSASRSKQTEAHGPCVPVVEAAGWGITTAVAGRSRVRFAVIHRLKTGGLHIIVLVVPYQNRIYIHRRKSFCYRSIA